nr:immunoglobulin heavy chain junction region [Macaca mulatta]
CTRESIYSYYPFDYW